MTKLIDQKINQLCDEYGFDFDWENFEFINWIETVVLFDGSSPAICINSDCDYSTDMEPDQDRGYCEDCKTNSVKSIGVLLGVI